MKSRDEFTFCFRNIEWQPVGFRNTCYEENLKKLQLRPEAHELFDFVLEDENI